jgi:hypothetical protein
MIAFISISGLLRAFTFFLASAAWDVFIYGRVHDFTKAAGVIIVLFYFMGCFR